MKQLARLVVTAFWVLALVHPVLSQENVADEAASAYERGAYDTAIRLYEALLAGGSHDGSIFYNLGAAYYQSGDSAMALVNYRRAQNLIPRDDAVNTNIALVRARRLDVQGDETGLLEGLSALTSSSLTVVELAWIAFALWTLFFAMLSAAILQRRLRELLRAPLLIVGVVALAGLLMLGSRLYVTASAPSAVVLESTVQAMSGPSEDFLGLFQLHEAAELHVLESSGDWIRFSLPDGRQGWIPRNSIEPV